MSFIEKKFDVTEEDIARLMGVFAQLPAHLLWSKVSRDDFTVRRFDGGFVNNISCCQLTPEARKRLVKRPDDLPEIVVKFASKEFPIKYSRIEFVTINTAMSELGITPKIIYVDETCIINEFIESRNSNYEDDTEPETIKQMARVLARLHSAKPPISRLGFKSYYECFNEDGNGQLHPIFQGIQAKEYLEQLKEETPEIREKYYSLFEEIDLKGALRFCLEVMEKVGSPKAFCHCDFNRGNRIVKETMKEDGTKEKKIYVVDFDFSSVNYRGFDIGRYFSNYRQIEEMFGYPGFPSDEEMKILLVEYREECSRLQGSHYLEQEENSLQQLIRESKVFALFAYIDFFFCLMLYTMDPMGPRKEYNLKAAFDRYTGFKELKQRFIADGTIPYILKNVATL